MRKEVVIAIILGLVLGSILVYGIYTANKAAKDVIQPTQQTQEQPENEQKQNSILTVNSPEDGDILDTPTATISGQTSLDNALVIITETDQFTPNTDENGFFYLEVELIKGGNLIQVTAITPSGQRRDEYLNLVYTTSDNKEEK